MKGLQTLSTLHKLLEGAQEPPSTVFTYAILAETERIVAICAKRETDPPRAMIDAYRFIADEYMYLRHFSFAQEYYLKTLELFQKCDKNIFEDKEAAAIFENCCVNLLKIYGGMGEESIEAGERILMLVSDVLPERFDAVHKEAMKEPTIKNDPVEYTDKYLNILIELETKIAEELKDVPQGMGYCFEYWEVKQRILEEDYGIDWVSPAVLNPDTRFD